MYVPKHFAVEDRARMIGWMRQYGFALLVSTGEDGAPFASHLPLVHVDDGTAYGKLQGHMARANPHWKLFPGSAPSMVMFWGPHAYISPKWYANKLNVPTWNYLTVHAYGHPRIVADSEAVMAQMATLVEAYEPGPEPWRIGDLPAGHALGMTKGIVAFELPIERIDAKAKLSQNKGADDRAGAAAMLEKLGGEDNLATAKAMRAVDGQ